MKPALKTLPVVLTLISLSSLALFTAVAQDAAPDSTTNTFVDGDAMPDAPARSPRGDFHVGVRTLEVMHLDQIDMLRRMRGDADARYDRPLTLEVWYPAVIPDGETEQVIYEDVIPASSSEAALTYTKPGRALRDAQPDTSGAPYPLLVVAHGYPGSRVQMAYLTENLASKGYVVVAIDHTDSTFADVGDYRSTLMNRPLDIRFVIDQIEAMSVVNDGNTSFLSGLVDAANVGLVGYSMGGYGSLNVVGAGFNQTLRNFVGEMAAPLLAGDVAYAPDSRVRAVVALAPFGADLSFAGSAGRSFWDNEALAGIQVPVLFIVGSLDDVAGYETGVRRLYENAVNSDRYLLTFENARHNVGSPPAPPIPMSYERWVGFGDSVWDNRRMNNVVQHFATAFFDVQLKGIAEEQRYLDNTTRANWAGFPPRSSVGLILE
ncbi:MAG: dienelactone hydrolase, partial [Anaerolineae bacterium]|nr:dienelactone hydrolase [Anaerolineae bacterium]